MTKPIRQSLNVIFYVVVFFLLQVLTHCLATLGFYVKQGSGLAEAFGQLTRRGLSTDIDVILVSTLLSSLLTLDPFQPRLSAQSSLVGTDMGGFGSLRGARTFDMAQRIALASDARERGTHPYRDDAPSHGLCVYQHIGPCGRGSSVSWRHSLQPAHGDARAVALGRDRHFGRHLWHYSWQ